MSAVPREGRLVPASPQGQLLSPLLAFLSAVGSLAVARSPLPASPLLPPGGREKPAAGQTWQTTPACLPPSGVRGWPAGRGAAGSALPPSCTESCRGAPCPLHGSV